VRFPPRLRKHRPELAAMERKSADVSAALSREDSLRTKLDREIDAHRKKAARFREQLDSVNTPEQAAAIEHEINFETAEADRQENEEYASLSAQKLMKPPCQTRAQVESLSEVLEGVRPAPLRVKNNRSGT